MKDPVSKPTSTKGTNVPTQPDRQQQETTEIRITVKEEEDDALKGERNPEVKQSGVLALVVPLKSPQTPHRKFWGDVT